MPAAIPHFKVGQTYSRKQQITGVYGGSAQSGIAPSSQSPAIFLFTGLSGQQYGYADEFDESQGVLYYTGEGQVGDMTMTRGNLAIATHTASGRALHVFKTLGKGKPCLYLGEFIYDAPLIKRGPDKNGDERDIIVFKLMSVWKSLQIEIEEENSSQIDNTAQLSFAELRQAALDACQPQSRPQQTPETVRAVYQRSVKVKQYVLARANGLCELCGHPAPFLRKKDNSPYLEPHHINRLSDGGLDHPKFVGAICPDCHREIHSGVNGQQKNEVLREKVLLAETQIEHQLPAALTA